MVFPREGTVEASLAGPARGGWVEAAAAFSVRKARAWSSGGGKVAWGGAVGTVWARGPDQADRAGRRIMRIKRRSGRRFMLGFEERMEAEFGDR